MKRLKLDFISVSEDTIIDKMNYNNIYIEFSGGKDSLLATLLLYDKYLAHREKMRILYILTPLSHILNTLYVHYVARTLNLKLYIIYNIWVFDMHREYYYEITKDRTCTLLFKQVPLNDFVMHNKGIYVLGVRRYESKTRMRYKYKAIYDIKRHIYIYYPILNYTKKQRDIELKKLMKKYSIGTNPLWFFTYNKNRTSGDCYPCLYSLQKQTHPTKPYKKINLISPARKGDSL